MSVRTARTIALVWLLMVLLTMACTIACLVTDVWRSWTFRANPEPGWVAYTERGRTHYAPPKVAKWYDRFHGIIPWLILAVVPATVVAFIASDHECNGRRWGRHVKRVS